MNAMNSDSFNDVK